MTPAARVLGTVFVLLSLAGPLDARAQDEALSYAEALREASDRAPTVVQAAARVDVARAEIGTAGNVSPNARLSVGTTAYGARVTSSFYVFLPFFGRREASHAAAEAQAGVATEDVEVARLDARLAVALAFIDLWLAEREAEATAEASSRRARLADAVAASFDSGSASRLDSLRARSEAARARADAAAAQELRGAASARLARWLDRPAMEAPLATDGELPALDPIPPLETLLARLPSHPVFARVDAAESASRAAVRWHRRSLWPILGVQVGANLSQRNGGPNEYNGAVLLELPVYAGPNLARARSLEGVADADGAAAESAVTLDVIESRARLEAADARARAILDDVVPVAHEAADLAAAAYAAGDLDLTTTLAAEQAYLDARIVAERSRAERARAVVALEHAVGSTP